MTTKALQALAIGMTVLAVAGPARAEGDSARGEQLFRQCMTCHSIAEGDNRLGPSLYGVIDRPAGTVEGYNYSPAMRDAGIVWTPETIDTQLADPRNFVPGNRMGMMFPRGIPDAQDRADIIAYLLEATAPE